MGRGGSRGGGGQATSERPQAAVGPAEAALYFEDLGLAADAWGVAQYQEWWDGLSPEEREALSKYEGNLHEPLNAYLRGLEYGQAWSAAELKGWQAKLDRALAQGRLGRDLIVYRGIDESTAVFGYGPQDLVGKTIHEKGFMSTSLDRSVAQGGFTTGGADSVTLQIRVPKGSKGGYLGSLSGHYNAIEREFLMPRGQRFRVTKVRKTPGGYIADAEIY